MWWQAAKEIWKIWPGGIANGRKASSCTATVSTDGMMTKSQSTFLPHRYHRLIMVKLIMKLNRSGGSITTVGGSSSERVP